jgi:small nuclear ribonucleoprotein (snRNP)-like protein
MTLLRKSTSSDVEVELVSTKNGEVYNIQIEGHDDQRNLSSTDAYEALAECFKDANVRLPSRFIVEFGQHVLNQLLQKIR